MDKSKILRLCNEMEKEISEAWNCDVIEYDKAGHIISIAQKISAEISAPPKTNADRIRQMTDEELADIVRFWLDCDYCPINDGECQGNCYLAAMKWLKQEVSEDASD